ncbi:WCX domain-containing protein [Desulfonatronum parangueonense]
MFLFLSPSCLQENNILTNTPLQSRRAPRARPFSVPGDDEITFQVEVAELRELMWWAMQFGHEAEILEPAWLRRVEAEAALRTASVYSPTGTR